MINYENQVDTDQTAPVVAATVKQDADIHRLETLVVTQNQKIEILEREVRKLKNELRAAVSTFNTTRAR